jgi:hypothetical protein
MERFPSSCLKLPAARKVACTRTGGQAYAFPMSSIHDSFSLTFNFPYCFSKFARFQVDFSVFINFTRIFYFDPFISSSRFANCENNLRLTDEWWVFHHQWRKFTFFRWGANPPKFPTKLSNFRQPPPPPIFTRKACF